jgi:hypothetical protein
VGQTGLSKSIAAQTPLKMKFLVGTRGEAMDLCSAVSEINLTESIAILRLGLFK